MGAHMGMQKKLRPSQVWKSSRHQVRSRQNSWFSLIGWSSRRKAQSKSIIRQRKVLPCGATLQAWWRWPMKDSNSHLLQKRLVDHSSSSATIGSLFAVGRRAWSLSELSSIPRIVKQVVCPSTLSGWRGRPSLSQRRTQVSNPASGVGSPRHSYEPRSIQRGPQQKWK